MAVQSTEKVNKSGGCYCGALRFVWSGRPLAKGQCHCAPCQKLAGGGPNYFMLVQPEDFAWVAGTPARFTHPGVPGAVTRLFCRTCGTHILTQRPDQDAWVLKVGALDAPETFSPRFVLCAAEAQPFHSWPDGIPVYAAFPER